MNTDIRAKIERLTSVYENRVLVLIVLAALAICICLSTYTTIVFSGDMFQPEKGDVAVVTYEVMYNGEMVKQVAAWVDGNGDIHYKTETSRLAGLEVTVLVMIFINLGLLKVGYDTYNFLTGRYRRILIAKFRYRLNME